MTFIDTLIGSLETKNSHVCVGLDSRYDLLPSFVKKNVSISDALFSFNKRVIEATSDIAVVYKANVAFYEAWGKDGLEGLKKTNVFLRNQYPNLPILADCKRAELGDGVDMVGKEIFDTLHFTCMMVTPWFGSDTIQGKVNTKERGFCVYVHDSNPSAREIQDVELKGGVKLYEYVAKEVASRWNRNGNIFVEAGLTYPRALKRVRAIVGEAMPILTSGVGPQGGKIEDLRGAFGKHGKRLVVNSSRSIIFAGIGRKDYFGAVRKAAETLRKSILEQSIV